jgi:predicted phosphodiesterase
MKFLIASDLHLEFYKNININDFFDVSQINEQISLILAGDIGYPYHHNYQVFIQECSKIFKNVIIITGNHEYYCGFPISVVDDKIRDIVKKFNNVYFLQKNELIIDNIVILGCTLWTYIPDNNSNIVSRSINDYRKIIYLENGNEYQYDVEYNNNLNKDHIQWIFNNIEKYNDKKIIVITHHLPSWNMIHPKYLSNKSDSPINWAFANNLDELILKGDNLYYWICGHSHSTMFKRIGKCDIFLNPMGYPLNSNKKENEEYNNNFIFELE